ncbi:MAG: DNA polymerase III subunit delta' [Alphaproteobacteria bacterium]
MSVVEDYDRILQPRAAQGLVGAEKLQGVFLDALGHGRLHHAWLIGGPDSCGKATFAYQVAKFLLEHQFAVWDAAPKVQDLSVSSDSRAAAKISAGSHSDLLLLSRRWDADNKRMTAGIPVNDVRRLTQFLGSTAGEGGWRVVIVDKVDDMAPAAANALLKSLEEPPSNCLFLLISDNIQRLLPTIRSRCRKAMLPRPTDAEVATILQAQMDDFDAAEFALVEGLADGRVRYAMDLLATDHGDLRHDMQARLEEPPGDLKNLHALADALCSRGRDALFAEFLERARLFVHNRAKAVAGQGGANPWIDVWDVLDRQQRETETYNLDKKQLILNLFALLNKAKHAAALLPA